MENKEPGFSTRGWGWVYAFRGKDAQCASHPECMAFSLEGARWMRFCKGSVEGKVGRSCTPWKINMEPTVINHLERKIIFQPWGHVQNVNLQGCSFLVPRTLKLTSSKRKFFPPFFCQVASRTSLGHFSSLENERMFSVIRHVFLRCFCWKNDPWRANLLTEVFVIC